MKRRFPFHVAGTVFIYAVFLVSFAVYLRNHLVFRGVESWPSVSAKIIGSGGKSDSVPLMSRYAYSTSEIDSRYVEYEYVVADRTYRSIRSSPSGGVPLPPRSGSGWRAYYKPTAPQVAVLNPIPFDGSGVLIIAGFSGILVGAHLILSIIARKNTRSASAEQG